MPGPTARESTTPNVVNATPSPIRSAGINAVAKAVRATLINDRAKPCNRRQIITAVMFLKTI